MANKIGFIGAGQMAKAFGLTLVRKGIIKPKNLSVSCPEEDLLADWKNEGCITSLDNESVFETSDTIFWAIKPQIFSTFTTSATCKNSSEITKFHVSIMAGIPLSKFSSKITEQFVNVSTARVMPNIAMKTGSGCSVFTMGQNASAENTSFLQSLLEPLGLSYQVPEDHINAYCALFSSGIGFLMPILEAMSDGGVKMGIPRDKSLKIAAQTMKGAGELLLEGGSHPGTLKDAVCSPAGTTIEGIAALERGGVRAAIINAVEAACKRGDVLGGGS